MRVNLSDLFASFEHSVFRLEARDQYTVPSEADRLADFVAGRPMAPRTPANDGWLDIVTRATNSGKAMSRVHAVRRPLSTYVQFELELYDGNVDAGEEVYIADRDRCPDQLANLDRDFWLFDDSTVALMDYDDEGHFHGADDASDDLDTYRALRDAALAASVHYRDFMAGAQSVA